MTKKRKSNNPLADARKSQSFYENLWNKKSGLGYTLFVQYYGQQPAGVVVDTNVVAVAAGRNTKSVAAAAPQGQSRAAKRRRKKNGAASAAATSDKPEEEESTPPTEEANNRSRLLAQLDKNPAYTHLEPFLTALSKPLPLTFRLRNLEHCSTEGNKEDQELLKNELATLSDIVAPVPYDSQIYQALDSSLHKSALSRTSPHLKELLVLGSSNGLLARQELGSMLPIVGLYRGKHLRKNHRVLDTCASPGSKTLQALEVVGIKGRVLANDIHPKRLETLKEAVSRSGVDHLDRLVFMNHDASKYPLPKTIAPHVVVTDVPCSGDGTIRKDHTVLPTWSPATARALHELQVRILVRSLQLVRVGGVVSYSTCSLNPMENESVVQAALLMINNNSNKKESTTTTPPPPVELMEWPQLEGLTLRKGVVDWKVLDYADKEDGDGVEWVEYDSYENAQAAKMKHCYPTLWPASNAASLNLHHCRRLWPQDQDTGGFFVALFRKTADFSIQKQQQQQKKKKTITE